MKNVTFDPKELIATRFDKDDAVFYLKNLGLPFGVQIVFIIYTIMMMSIGRMSVVKGVIYLAVIVMLLVFCIGYLVYKRLSAQKVLKGCIDKIGMNIILADLQDKDNEVFFLHPDRYDTYIVISSRYVYFSREAIYPINEIKKIYIDINDNSCQIKAGPYGNKPFDPKDSSARNVIRFCKPAYVTTVSGTTDRWLAALTSEDMQTVNEMFREISERGN